MARGRPLANGQLAVAVGLLPRLGLDLRVLWMSAPPRGPPPEVRKRGGSAIAAGPLTRATQWGWTISVCCFPIRLGAMRTWKADAALPIDGDRGRKSEFPSAVHGSRMPRWLMHREFAEGFVNASKSSDARMFPLSSVAVRKCGAAARHSFQWFGNSRRAHLEARSCSDNTTCSVRGRRTFRADGAASGSCSGSGQDRRFPPRGGTLWIAGLSSTANAI